MLTLQKADGNTALRVTEDPQDVVQRLGRIETDDPQLVGLLTQLGPERLDHLGKLARQASKQLRRQRRAEQAGPSLFVRFFGRPEQFGD